jgi:hypothetical protein
MSILSIHHLKTMILEKKYTAKPQHSHKVVYEMSNVTLQYSQ